MSAPVPEPLRGLSRWVTAPSSLGGTAGALLAVAYGAVALELPAGTKGYFWAIVIGVVLALTFRGDRQEQRALSTVRKLSRGELPASTESLKKGVGEMFAFPDRAFFINLQNWILGVALAGVLFGLVPGAGWVVPLRIGGLGLVLAPVTSVLTYLLVLGRARAAVDRLSQAGLSAREVVASAPARAQLRRRLVAFAAATVLTPSLLIADQVLTRTDRALSRMLSSPGPQAQRAVLEAELTTAVLPVAALAVLVVLLVLVTGYLGGSALAEPMRAIAGEANRLAAGDLRKARAVPAEDEVWAASSAVTAVHSQLAEAISKLKRAGRQIAISAGELEQTASRHEQGAAEQASALTETSATTEELARSANQIAASAQEVAGIAEQTLKAAHEGKRSADAYFTAMANTRKGNQAIAESIVKLNKRVQQIGNIVEFIDGIADKSDLLAVNAELEGTKAGEVGRGFSLVAAEMRRLAEGVMQSTQEISRLIEDIRDATNEAVMATEAGTKATERGAGLSREVSEGLAEIVVLAEKTSEAVRSISAATQQQRAGTDQLAEVMGDILKSTHAGAAASREVVAANADLSALAKELQQVVGRFEVS
ncbi:MAG: methyl-accepting chemotaxis protein [Myxococcales bacterium]|nr:methyl-accepting chemotaxis protein [Myxococcales bacterium]